MGVDRVSHLSFLSAGWTPTLFFFRKLRTPKIRRVLLQKGWRPPHLDLSFSGCFLEGRSSISFFFLGLIPSRFYLIYIFLPPLLEISRPSQASTSQDSFPLLDSTSPPFIAFDLYSSSGPRCPTRSSGGEARPMPPPPAALPPVFPPPPPSRPPFPTISRNDHEDSAAEPPLRVRSLLYMNSVTALTRFVSITPAFADSLRVNAFPVGLRSFCFLP